jgi:hypothetical protein
MSIFLLLYILTTFIPYFMCVLVLCTKVNMMFVVLLWVCIHTGQVEKSAW